VLTKKMSAAARTCQVAGSETMHATTNRSKVGAFAALLSSPVFSESFLRGRSLRDALGFKVGLRWR
jgi:hypothetical protein